MNKQQLASTIWESANQMRSKIEPNEYKDFILGFIFHKYLSEKEVLLFKGMGFSDEEIKNLSESDAQSVEHAKKTLGYFISYKDLFSTWLSMGKDFDVSNVRDALSAFDRNIDDTYKKVYEKIFNRSHDRSLGYVNDGGRLPDQHVECKTAWDGSYGNRS